MKDTTVINGFLCYDKESHPEESVNTIEEDVIASIWPLKDEKEIVDIPHWVMKK